MNKPQTLPTEQIAIIEEAACIGCARCIKACPVDAILGAENLLHHVLKEECIGCQLCIAPCPVDCIEMINYQHDQPKAQRTKIAKQRIKTRKARLTQTADALALERQQRKQSIATTQSDTQHTAIKRLEIQIKKAEKALKNVTADKRAYAEEMLNRLYEKRKGLG